MRGCCTWGGFFLAFFLFFFLKKNAKRHMQNNQNDKKPALESEVGDPKPAGVVRCVARMRRDVRTLISTCVMWHMSDYYLAFACLGRQSSSHNPNIIVDLAIAWSVT